MVPYVLIGVGAAIAAGGYANFGLKAQSLHDELEAGIEKGPLYDEKSEEFLHNRLMADVVGGTGIVVAAYGVYRLVSD